MNTSELIMPSLLQIPNTRYPMIQLKSLAENSEFFE
jgi:hypothetical protein